MLQNGQAFPAMTFDAVGGGSISLPHDLGGDYAALLFYRGAWCPFCREQLAGYAAAEGELKELGVTLAAISVEDEATGAKLKDELRLRFSVGHGADATRVADAIGAYVNPEPRYLQPTAFILTADGSVRSAVYASNAVGRLLASEVTRLVRYAKSQTKGA